MEKTYNPSEFETKIKPVYFKNLFILTKKIQQTELKYLFNITTLLVKQFIVMLIILTQLKEGLI